MGSQQRAPRGLARVQGPDWAWLKEPKRRPLQSLAGVTGPQQARDPVTHGPQSLAPTGSIRSDASSANILTKETALGGLYFLHGCSCGSPFLSSSCVRESVSVLTSMCSPYFITVYIIYIRKHPTRHKQKHGCNRCPPCCLLWKTSVPSDTEDHRS